MTIFDRTLQYHFVVFTAAAPPDRPLPDLAPTLEAPVPAVEGLGLKLRPTTQAQFSFTQGGATVASQSQSWTSASGLWRFSWTPERIDVVFNARGYADVRETDVPSQDLVRKRVVGNLLAACKVAGQHVIRVAAIVTADSSCRDRSVQEVVASLFLNEEAQRAAEKGMAVDLMARTNLQEKWPFKGPDGASRALLVNRLQSATAVGILLGDAFDTYLSVQIDVNTAANVDLGSTLDGAELSAFFERAVTWTNERLKAFEGAACRQ